MPVFDFNAKKEEFDIWAEQIKEDAAEAEEEILEKAETACENVREKIRDDVEDVLGTYHHPDDISLYLQDHEVKERICNL